MSDGDLRPPVWVGHIVLETSRLDDSEKFMQVIGMRPIAKGEDFAVLELRGGTHLVLAAKEDVVLGEAPFDLMVEDLEATHKKFAEMGLSPSPIEVGQIHQWFYVREPAGHTVKFNSSHVSDRPV